ncbi:MAG TPA: hypothetical protein VHL60_11085 [Oxalicibacterium sp.]|jgi:hypothetical protein|nr:hypothetical protein [Oxalicibacterium sp.]
MKTLILVSGCFPALRGLNAEQFANAIGPRLIDIRNPRTGLQVDLFGRVSDVRIGEMQGEGDDIAVEIEVDDAFLQRHGLTPQELREVLVGRITKLRHPATGAMSPVRARLAATQA